MKTLASCKPSEFLRQSNLIRKSVDRWLTETDIMNIRKRLPHMELVPINATQEEKEEINEKNTKARNDQMRKNLSDILDAVMDEHESETLEVLALCCFVEPKDIDNYTVSEVLGAFNELINDENVMSFFTSLVRLGQTVIRNA